MGRRRAVQCMGVALHSHRNLAVCAVEDQGAVGKGLEVRGVHKLLAVHGQVGPEVLFAQQACQVQRVSRRQAGPRVRRRARTSNTMWTTPLAVDGPVAGGGPRSLPTAATAAAADDHSATSRRGSTILLSVFGTHCQRRRLNSLEMNIATASRRGACDSRPLGDGTLPSYNGICTQAQFPPRQNFGPELQQHGAGRTRPR
jgi:hypothetical protein